MSQPTDPSRDLLFGLLALQNGLIDQGALFAAFAAWTRDKGRSLADHLVELGHLDAPRRAAVEAIAGLHVQTLGGDLEKSLAVLAVGRSTRESLARAGGPDVEATLGHVALGARARPATTMTPTAPAAIPSARPPPTDSGSASSGRTRGAAWGPSSWRSTASCTARWR